MELLIHRRAEIALRSLQKADQVGIERALMKVSALDRIALSRDHNFRLLPIGFYGRKIATYRATKRLRLVLAFENDACIVEDIIAHDRLDKLINREGQK
jgi:hypothetical protein